MDNIWQFREGQSQNVSSWETMTDPGWGSATRISNTRRPPDPGGGGALSDADSRIRGRLQPCCWRLVSADSSPLMVRGELCMTIVFPGLQCDMLVIASIGSEGLLGTEALQSCLPHQLDLRRGSCGPMDSPHCSNISNVSG